MNLTDRARVISVHKKKNKRRRFHLRSRTTPSYKRDMNNADATRTALLNDLNVAIVNRISKVVVDSIRALSFLGAEPNEFRGISDAGLNAETLEAAYGVVSGNDHHFAIRILDAIDYAE